MREALIDLVQERGFAIDEASAALIRSEMSTEKLGRWLRRVVKATSLAELLAG